MIPALTDRALNRATLARQYLLDRTDVPVLEAIEHLGGMQSQAPLAPYVGLWSRLSAFDPAVLSELMSRRETVRTHLMRTTVHLVSARDCLDWHTLFQPRNAAAMTPNTAGLPPIDRTSLRTAAERLLRASPRTRAELGRLLAASFVGADPGALAFAAAQEVAMCQVPPRGLWGRTGPAAWALVEKWLGEAPRSTTPVSAVVLRGLGAFGPATIADLQTWSGLTRLGEVVGALSLRTFRSPAGPLLYDLPDAPRPDEDTPAPPRFLPEYDNLLLSHRDRTRFIPSPRRVPLPPGNGATMGTYLLDGTWQGTWRLRGETLDVEPFTPPADPAPLLAEASRLAAFLGGSTARLLPT
ncbi:winged helix DNA-binding domain-containing protein [Paractinoplanes toevensis]|uniref:Winged helix DNA-binding domain-containing protein n=1 Tax=Paractinoplanes toevensis TaxID=571911 RepID=A0A919W5U0_9ACTN|nr:winged helix DNA-binding domain-containing protein [Actinoplanes toevensis]GIM91803.1 hypothetical protein Ato02nite_035960 [Actinoplanes toevensis]